MTIPQQIAKHFREVYFGGNWTGSNMKDVLSGIPFEQAVKKIEGYNTIAVLVFHTGYYVNAVLKVFQGEPLNAHDTFSFDMPPLSSEAEWQQLQNRIFDEATQLAALVEQMPEAKLQDDLADPKYGNYYRNINGIIQHTHYHLGQIALLKKMTGL